MFKSYAGDESNVLATSTKTLVLGKLSKNSGWALDIDPKSRLIDVIKAVEEGKCIPIKPLARIEKTKEDGGKRK